MTSPRSHQWSDRDLDEVRTTGRDGQEELTLRQFEWAGASAEPVTRAVDLRQRPSAVSVPGYLQKVVSC